MAENGNSSGTGIGKVATVFVPVADQDRALRFYLEKLGFEKRADFQYGQGSRWLEVAPRGSAIAMALVSQTEGKAAGGDAAHCALTTKDIEAEHAALRAGGVDVDEEVASKGSRRSGLLSLEVSVPDPVPRQFFLRDTDGNRFLVVESA
jgi:catechol 2,3-dioxygenase-like lactoylglutathione lyase family enzyme